MTTRSVANEYNIKYEDVEEERMVYANTLMLAAKKRRIEKAKELIEFWGLPPLNCIQEDLNSSVEFLEEIPVNLNTEFIREDHDESVEFLEAIPLDLSVEIVDTIETACYTKEDLNLHVEIIDQDEYFVSSVGTCENGTVDVLEKMLTITRKK